MQKLKSNTFNLRPNKGFTLIELLVVIAIIGVLTSISVLFLSEAREKSRDARRFEDIKQIQNALELYSADRHSLYPSGNTFIELTAGDYIRVIPNDPLNIGAHLYSYQGTDALGNACSSGLCTSYVLKTVLEQDTQQALKVDIDGTLAGMDCADPAFCVIP